MRVLILLLMFLLPGCPRRNRATTCARRDADGFPAGGESLPLHLGAPRRRPGATALADRAGLLPVPEAPALRRTRPGLAAAAAAGRKPQRRVLRRVAGLSPEPGTDPAGGRRRTTAPGLAGCADAGLCYPPQSQALDLGGTGPAAAVAGTSGEVAEDQGLAGSLQAGNLAWSLLLFFGLGLLLAFAPVRCRCCRSSPGWWSAAAPASSRPAAGR